MNIFPAPSSCRFSEDTIDCGNAEWIKISPDFSANLKRQLSELAQEFSSCFANGLKIIAGSPAMGNIFMTVSISGAGIKKQGYKLRTTQKGIVLDGVDEAGIFYGIQTLRQILKKYGSRPKAFAVSDHPDFSNRGVMLDVSRCKVPTMKNLFQLVDMFASMKLNQLQLYIEHTFAFSAHETVWRDASPFSAADIMELEAYCAERYMELVPNFNSFGHFERWLRHSEYKKYAECPDGFEHPWGGCSDHGSTLKPEKESLALLNSLYSEYLPNFSSKLFNVGCDETWELGLGRSKKLCETKGKTRVYLDFLLKIDELTRKHGRRMMFWGDIILHEPELIKELPKDVVALNWGYEANHPFKKQAKCFAEAGVPFYVCPGTSSWNSLTGRTQNCLENLANAAENGSRFGAEGFLNTDWGDGGHHQPQPVSYIGYAAGAAYSWSYKANKDTDMAAALNEMAFMDKTGITGHLFYDLGKALELMKARPANCSVFNKLLFWDMKEEPECMKETGKPELKKCIAKFEELIALASRARPESSDGKLVIDEFRHAAGMAKLSAQKAVAFLEKSDKLDSLRHDLERIISNHEKLWLARNKVGGLRESSGKLRDSMRAFENNK